MARRRNEKADPATAAAILKELSKRKNPAQAANLRRFFKTGPGEYGAGDEFLGLKVPQVRAVLARFPEVPRVAISALLASRLHEARFFAVIALVRAYDRGAAGVRHHRIRRLARDRWRLRRSHRRADAERHAC